MGDFAFDPEDLADSSSLTEKTAQQFYAFGEPIKTSYSEFGDPQRTLTQRDLNAVLGGEALYRNPAFSLQASHQMIQSNINSILVAGATDASSGARFTTENGSVLTDDDAFHAIVSKTSLGRYSGPFGLDNIYKSLARDVNSDSTLDGHADGSAAYNPNAAEFGESRPIAFEFEMTPEELEIYKTRSRMTAPNVKDSSYATNGTKYSMIVPEDLRNKGFTETASWDDIFGPNGTGYYPKVNPEYFQDKYQNKTIWPAATLIEFILQLANLIQIKGSYDPNRGFTGAAREAATVQGFITDHSFFRAFDISAIGRKGGELIELNTSTPAKYKEATEILLNAMNGMTDAPYLFPDSLIISDELEKEYGINLDGWEDKQTSGVLKKYPNLFQVNFYSKSNHRDHIHISYGPSRAGSYKGWVGSSTSLFPQTPGSSLDSQTGIVPGTLPRGNPNDQSEVWERFETRTTQVNNLNAVYRALLWGGFGIAEAAILMAIAERESNLSPAGFNGGVNGSGDYSIGMWQLNFYGSQKWLYTNMPLLYKDGTGKIVREDLPGYKILFKDWQKLGIKDAATAVAKMKEIEKNGKTYGRSLMDPRALSVGAQIAWLPYWTSFRKTGWMFWAWGEYDGSPPAGWLRHIKFSTAVDFYCQNNPGKTAEDLRRWCVSGGLDQGVPSYKYVNDWMQGQTFNSDGTPAEKYTVNEYKDGWFFNGGDLNFTIPIA